MKKVLSVILALTLILTMLLLSGWAKNTELLTKPLLPNHQNLTQGNGEHITGKALHGINDSGHFQPNDALGNLESLDVTDITNLKPLLPDYKNLDQDLLRDLKGNGEHINGKELHQVKSSGYFQPDDAVGNLEPLDVRGNDHKGIAIIVDFPVTGDEISDVPGVDFERIPTTKFDDLLNGDVYNPYDLDIFKDLATYEVYENDVLIDTIEAPIDRTMKNYYNEVSYNQFGIDVDVVGWYELPHDYDYYLGQDKGFYNDNGDAFIAELVMDAINLADEDGVDFSDYAVPTQQSDFSELELEEDYYVKDGVTYDQIVPNVFIIHRGTGAEYSTDPNIIWSHKWSILSASYFGELFQTGEEPDVSELEYMTIDGVILNTYNIVPEVGQDISGYLKYLYPDIFGDDYTGRDPSPAYPGVYSHEFGHVLGLPDLYDYGYDSEGVGMFTLMATGSYGRNIPDRWYSGNTPVHMDAWSKCYLGFVEPIEIKPEDGKQTVTLHPANESKDIYKVVAPGSDGREYFLLENRQQVGFDAGLSYNIDGEDLHGLVVYHVVNDIFERNFHRPNEAQNWSPHNRGFNLGDDTTYGEYHYAMSVIQADGLFDLEHNNNDGDSGDVYPGKNNVTKINPRGGSPNTVSLYEWNDGNNETGIIIENITEDINGIITCDIYFGE